MALLVLGTPEWHREIPRVVARWTAWDSLDEMCRNSPTLRAPEDASLEEMEGILNLRYAFAFKAGREAHGDQTRDLMARYLSRRAYEAAARSLGDEEAPRPRLAAVGLNV